MSLRISGISGAGSPNSQPANRSVSSPTTSWPAALQDGRRNRADIALMTGQQYSHGLLFISVTKANSSSLDPEGVRSLPLRRTNLGLSECPMCHRSTLATLSSPAILHPRCFVRERLQAARSRTSSICSLADRREREPGTLRNIQQGVLAIGKIQHPQPRIDLRSDRLAARGAVKIPPSQLRLTVRGSGCDIGDCFPAHPRWTRTRAAIRQAASGWMKSRLSAEV